MGLRSVLARFFSGIGPRNFTDIKVDYCIVGIGNPGLRYRDTRHNIGFCVVDKLTSQMINPRLVRWPDVHIVTGTLPGGKTIAGVKPGLFVNRSGNVVKDISRIFGSEPSRCFVVVDDFNLALGRVRLRRSGSDGGHNGLKSIIDAIGNGFPRLRVGVGPLPATMSSIDFVLGTFSPQEKILRDEVVSGSVDAIHVVCDQGIDAAMKAFNNK